MFSSPPCHLEQRPAAAWRLIMHLSFDGFDGSRFTGSICPPNEPLYCSLTSSRRLNDVLYGNVWILVCLLKPRAAWSWFICCVHAGQEQDSHGLENWNVRKNKAQEDHKLKIIGNCSSLFNCQNIKQQKSCCSSVNVSWWWTERLH